MLGKYKLFRKLDLLLLLIIISTFKETKAKHEKTPRRILPIISNYERLKDTLSPVLARINRSAQKALQNDEDYDYDYGIEDGFDEEDDKIAKNPKSSPNFYIYREYVAGKELPLSSPFCNKSHTAPSYYKLDYDSISPVYPENQERPSPLIVYGRIDNAKDENAIKKLVQELRKDANTKHPESLYEKYKETLGPIMKHFNASIAPPKQFSMAAFQKLLEKRKKIVRDHPTAAYNSLYDEFKKRLMEFSSDLGIKTDLNHIQSLRSKLMNEVKYKEGSTNEDHITKEYEKAQNLAENIEKETVKSNCICKSVQSIDPRKQRSNFIQRKPAIRRNENNNNGFVNNDHNDKDCIRSWPFFRRHEEEIKSKKRGTPEKDNQSYLSLNKNNPALDGTAYNKFLTTVYAEPTNRALSNLTAMNLLERVAGHMNLTTLDVAKKVASIQGLDLASLENDPELHKILQEYIENSAAKSFENPTTPTSNLDVIKDGANATDRPIQMENHESQIIKALEFKPFLQTTESTMTQRDDISVNALGRKVNSDLGKEEFAVPKLPPPTPPSPTVDSPPSLSNEQVAEILQKLTKKLEEIQIDKVFETCQPREDLPCKLTGAWQSKVMGLRFDIKVKDSEPPSSLPIEAWNRDLNVTIRECTPPRPHDVIELNWPITGSTLSETGGPFFLYTQKRTENLLATFVGYCRNCGGTDTIFGTWCISFPSKNCQDTTASFQTKSDILRRYTLEEKRDERRNERKSKKH